MQAKPERLQKILAAAGIASRRKAEALIASGSVSVNGHTVTELGTKADPRMDEIRVDGKLLRGPERHVYLAMYKPKGHMTTVSDPEGRPTVMDLLKGVEQRVFPVGRLDYMSEGLLLLTNDGDLMAQLTRAGSHVAKSYMVKVSGKPSEEAVDKLRQGILLPPEPGLTGARGKKQPGVERRSFAVTTRPAEIHLAVDQENPWFEVTITEGRNRQLRRMFEQVGHHIEKIKRIRYGSLTLDLEPGQFRYLTPKEVGQLRKSLERPFKPKTAASRAGRAAHGKPEPVRAKTSLAKPGRAARPTKRFSEGQGERTAKPTRRFSEGRGERAARPTKRFGEGQGERTARPTKRFGEGQGERAARPTKRFGEGQGERAARPTKRFGEGQGERAARPTKRFGEGQGERAARPAKRFGEGQGERAARPTKRFGEGQGERAARPMKRFGEGPGERRPRVEAARFVRGRRGRPSAEGAEAAPAARSGKRPAPPSGTKQAPRSRQEGRDRQAPRGPEFASKGRTGEPRSWSAPAAGSPAKRKFSKGPGKPYGNKPAGRKPESGSSRPQGGKPQQSSGGSARPKRSSAPPRRDSGTRAPRRRP